MDGKQCSMRKLFFLQFREVILPNRILAWTKKTDGGTLLTNISKTKSSQEQTPPEMDQCKLINDGNMKKQKPITPFGWNTI